ncbi:uncharacterized protein LOC113331349 [Papaver somniferum]|uniref:uncharacterized protein LOC113331349 n=1 Tax=Papaver somniferum TaxID=3469 RepID=UPI000E6FB1B3|nr:uncharacterized protein LOC113331349 [Papaver somniferum]
MSAGGGWEKVKSSSRSFDLGGGNGGGGIVIGRERLRSIDLSDHSSSPSPNSAGSSAPVIPPTRTVTLGRVQPQHPAHRSIVCNDREANFPVRFKMKKGKEEKFFFCMKPIYLDLVMIKILLRHSYIGYGQPRKENVFLS